MDTEEPQFVMVGQLLMTRAQYLAYLESEYVKPYRCPGVP